tara:strand:- start:278 stop:955 length:678 start_codon:yes stop_codon:yes gene_type:complete
MRLLKFGSSSNAKLDKINEWHDGKRPPQVLNFSLPSGYSCPSARDCQSWFNPKTRKMTKGKDAKYTCFATTMQRNPSVMNAWWHNFNLLKEIRYDVDAMTKLITNSLYQYSKPDYVRIHVSGDFFTAEYFQAWINVANDDKDVKFYAYTKELETVKKYEHMIPDNLILTLSEGGKDDHLLDEINIKKAVVVHDEKSTTLPIDTNEYHAVNTNQDFALVVHGTQLK